MKLGLLFSGQGSQKPGMGKDLYDTFEDVKELYDSIDTEFDIKEISFRANDSVLKQTIYTQPVIVAFHLAVLRRLKALGVKYDYVAGLSLGEFSALVAAGVLSESEAMSLIETRAVLMSRSCEEAKSGLLAVLGLDSKEVEDALRELEKKGAPLWIANLNCPKQVVIGGRVEHLDLAEEYFVTETSARVVALEVQGAFHTELMQSAYEGFKGELEKYEFHKSEVPIIYNRLGRPVEDEDLRDLLSDQLKSTTYFEKSIRYMIAEGVDTFLEIGFNDIFKGFIKRIDRKVRVIPVNSVETLEELEKEVRQ